MLISRRLRTWALLALVNLLWATQYPAYRVVSESVSASALNFWTFVIAIAVLLPALIRSNRRSRSHPAVHVAVDAWRFFLLSALGVIPPSVLAAWGIARSTASNASILSLTIPVLMVLMGMVMLKERPGRYLLLSLGLALAGTALVSWDDIAAGNFGGSMLVGNIAVFLGGAGAAFYNAYGKRLLNTHSPVEVLVYGYVAAATQCAALSGFFDVHPFYVTGSWSLTAWAGIFVLGAVVWGVAMLLWMWLLNQLELGQISVSVYMLPVFGLVLSALLLHEHVNRMQLVGGVIVLLSAYMASMPPAQGSPSQVSSPDVDA